MHLFFRTSLLIIACAPCLGYAQTSGYDQWLQPWRQTWTQAATQDKIPIALQNSLEEQLTNKNPEVNEEAVIALWRSKSVHCLILLVDFPKDQVSRRAARCLVDFPSKEAAAALLSNHQWIEVMDSHGGSEMRGIATMWRATFTSALYKIAGVVPKPEFLDREKREVAFRKAIAEMDATEVGKREETSYNKWVQAFNKAADRDHLTATEREDMEEMISCGPELEITRVIVNLTRSDHRNTVVAALDHPSNTVKWIAAETLENPILSFAPHYLTKAAAEALQAALRKLDAENSESAEAKIARERAAAAIVKSLYTVTGTAPKEEHSNPKERDAAFEKAIQEMPAAK